MNKSLLIIAAAGSTLLACSCWAQEVEEVEITLPQLISAHVAQAPTLDGKADDEVWQSATALQVVAKRVLPPNEGAEVPVTIRSVYTDTYIYFLATWEDATESVSHKTWVWDSDKKTYEQGDDREDMFALGFEHEGSFTADMFSGEEAVWDVWHWKAHRSNPAGYAMDKTHHYTLEKPEGKAKSYEARNGKTIWIARLADTGESTEKKQPPPATHQGDRVPQYVEASPSGSVADVRAKGVWAEGRWTLELGRKLNTGHADDTVFDPKRSYRMAVAPFDQTGSMDKASGLIVLLFGKSQVFNFENGPAGGSPEGWRVETTNSRGPDATWNIVADSGAPSGSNVLTLTSPNHNFGGAYNLCWRDDIRFKNGILELEVRANTGEEDQGGGPIWRVKDKNNYYIARYNPLENNFRVYYVKDGARKMLASEARLEIGAGEWFTIRIVHNGPQIEGWLEGNKLLEVEDATFSDTGGVGFWTKADAATSFDDFSVVFTD